MANVRVEIEKHIAVLSEKENGWKKELNVVSWNDAPGKLDIREWSEDHTRMSRGITLTDEEAENLRESLNEIYM